MRTEEGEGIICGVAEDKGAGGDGLRAVGVVVGADGGIGQLQGYSVHQVAHKKQVAELVGGVAWRVAFGGNRQDVVGKYLARFKGYEVPLVGVFHLSGGIRHGFLEKGPFGSGNVQGGVGIDGFSCLVQQAADMVEVTVREVYRLYFFGLDFQGRQAFERLAALGGGQAGVEHKVSAGRLDHKAVHRRGHFAVRRHRIHFGFVGFVLAVIEGGGLKRFVGAYDSEYLIAVAAEAKSAFGGLALLGKDCADRVVLCVYRFHAENQIQGDGCDDEYLFHKAMDGIFRLSVFSYTTRRLQTLMLTPRRQRKPVRASHIAWFWRRGQKP